ncbi:MAG: response regulator transcription factor [Verrucomicrobiales bacterium]|nr:response regulator transcription factor [Verrucomicrobiales bacterium]
MSDLSQPVRILIVDDHPVLRAGVRQILASDPRFDVVAEAGNPEEALRCARDLCPGVVVLDLELGGASGFEVAKQLQAERLQIPVVVLTMHRREAFFNEAVELGASGFVLKENTVTELIDAVAAAARGETWFSPTLAEFWTRRSKVRADLVRENPEIADLTPTERKVLRAIAANRTTREIAEDMGVSPLTIETHRRNICRKLGLVGSHPLLDFALRNRDRL